MQTPTLEVHQSSLWERLPNGVLSPIRLSRSGSLSGFQHPWTERLVYDQYKAWKTPPDSVKEFVRLFEQRNGLHPNFALSSIPTQIASQTGGHSGNRGRSAAVTGQHQVSSPPSNAKLAQRATASTPSNYNVMEIDADRDCRAIDTEAQYAGRPVDFNCLSPSDVVFKAKGAQFEKAPSLFVPGLNNGLSLGNLKQYFADASYLEIRNYRAPFSFVSTKDGHTKLLEVMVKGKIQNVFRVPGDKYEPVVPHFEAKVFVKIGDTPDEMCVIGIQPIEPPQNDAVKAGYQLCEFVGDPKIFAEERHLQSPRLKRASENQRNIGWARAFQRRNELMTNPPSCHSVSVDELRRQSLDYPPIERPSEALTSDGRFKVRERCNADGTPTRR